MVALLALHCVVFPAPSGLNGQEKRGESGAAGRARRALRPWVGPQWAPRVPWGPGPKRARLQCSLAPTTAQARSLSLLLIATSLAICCCEPAAATRRPSRPPGRPRLESCCRTQHGRRRPAPVLSAPALSACRAGFHRQHRRPSLLPVDRGDRQDPGVPQGEVVEDLHYYYYYYYQALPFSLRN